MPDSILVVEYEPRYIERVRQALTGHSQLTFAKDGEEAVNLLQSGSPRLIVLSSIIPKISTAELIRRIRDMAHLQLTPILITVSGYNGKSPKADAVKLGATDILPKPYSEGEFLNKVKQLLESPAALAPEATIQIPKISPDSIPSPPPDAPEATIQIPQMSPEELARAAKETSEDVFADNVDEPPAKKPATKSAKSSAELDKLLETTLSGLQNKPKKTPSTAKADTKKSSAELDKLLETTLSGLQGGQKKTPKKTVEQPRPEAPDTDRPQPKAEAPLPPPPKPPEPAPKPAEPAPKAEPPQPAAPPVVPEYTEAMAIPTAEELEAEKQRIAAEAKPPVEPEPAKTEMMPLVEPPKPEPPPSPEESVPVSSPVLPDSEPDDEEDEGEETDGIRFGQYILQEKIATGGMAEVWKARMRGVEGFQKTVAIKKILPHMSDNEEFLTMFVDEAKLAAQLSHNNIIHIYELGKIRDSYFIAMEYIDGHDLKSITKRGTETGQPLGIELALFVASKVASALDYAHRKRDFDEKELGLVHRDVSPQNVLISYEGDIKLCDFGIAKAASKASHTIAGALKGKLQYMSPEQAWGKHIDRRSDIFALATVLFEMLTGRKLFKGDSELSVLEQVREARVVTPSSVNDEVPARVDAIVAKAFSKDPDDRYQTAGEMAKDLDEVLYSYRPTPTSADLAIHMHRLFMEEPPAAPPQPIIEEPQMADPEPEAFAPEPVAVVAPPPELETVPIPELVPEPEPEPEPAPPPMEPAVPVEAVAESHVATEFEEGKKFPVVPVSIAAVLLIAAIGTGAFFMMGKTSEPTATTAQTTPSPVAATPAAPPSSDTIDPLTTDTTTTDLVDPEATATDTALDQELIDQEVQRRLDEERARLETQRQEQLKRAQDQARPPAKPAQQTPPPKPAPQAETPEPQAEATPPPVETPPATATQAPEPAAPAPPPPGTPRQALDPKTIKVGDLVPIGTPGLVAPQLSRFKKPSYPLAAKMQKVEGIVIVKALISETGEVLEVKILRGVDKDVGINEAAIDAIKRSRFKPATIDGKKVKSHYTRTIPFKL